MMTKHDPSLSDEDQKRFRRRREKAIAAYRERLEKENAVDLSQFPDKIFVHHGNDKRYVFVDGCSMRIGDKWRRAVLYREEEGTDLYVRPVLEFIRKFSLADEQT